MLYRSFFIPTIGGQAAAEELNKFLSSVRLISVDKKYSDNLDGWSMIVSYYDDSSGFMGQRKERADYSSVLTEEEYARFLKLKKIRSVLYKREGIAAYMIFTDDELAEISRCPDFSVESFGDLKVKRKRLEKYGKYFIEKMNTDEQNWESDGEDMLSK